MGNLINPLSRILGFKKNLFWGNNFSFYYFQDVYKQKIFKIRCFKKIFKFIFRYIFRLFKIPRVYYNLKFNFIGQANSILNIDCEVRNLNRYNMAILVHTLQSDSVSDIKPIFRYYRGALFIKSKLQRAIRFLKIRFEKRFIKWRTYLLKFYFQRIEKKKQLKSVKVKPLDSNRSFKFGRLNKLFKYSRQIMFELDKNYNIDAELDRTNFDLNLLKKYFKTKFKVIGARLKLYRSFHNKYFVNIFNFIFKLFFSKISYNFGIRNIKLNLKKKKVTRGSIVRDVNHFCYLALRKGYRINYVIKVVRRSVIFLKAVRGFQLIVSGRFYRRGRAMFRVSTLGEVGSQSGKGSLLYRNSERVKEYGMCSIKLLFFFRRNLKIFNKIPLRCKWFHYLKFLRAKRKIRNQFGHIRY